MDWFWNNIGSIATIVSFIIGGIAFVITIRHDLQTIDKRMIKFEDEVIGLRKVVVELARQEARLDAVDQGMLELAKRIDANNMRVDRILQKVYDQEIK